MQWKRSKSMEQKYKFLSANEETGELDIDLHKALDYLIGYTPEYVITFNISSLRSLGQWKKEAIEQGSYDSNFESLLFDFFVNDVNDNAWWWHQTLSNSAMERHLDIAKEYMGYIGELSVVNS